MAPVVLYVADIIGTLATTEGVETIAVFLVNYSAVIGSILTAVAIDAASRLLTKATGSNANSLSGQTLTIRDPLASRQIIYGQTRAGGVLVYAGTSGSSQEFLHLVICHAGHQCNAMSTLWLVDEVVPLDGSGNATGKYAGFVICKDHLGAPGQTVESLLNAAIPGDWPTTSTLSGITYSYIQLKYSTDLFPGGLPNVSRFIQGKLCLDTRSSTTAWTENAALCIRDYLTDTMLGLGATTAEMDDNATNTAANISDEAINLLAGGTEPRYTINGIIDSSVDPGDTLNDMLAAMAGICPYVGGKFIMKAGAHTASVQNFTLNDARGAITLNLGDPMADSFNSIRGSYISPANDWQAGDIVPLANATYIAQDGGIQSWKDVTLPLTTSPATAQRLIKLELERSRTDLGFVFPAKLTAMNVRCGDIVDFTIPIYAWTGVLFEVVSLQYVIDSSGDAPQLGIDLTLRSTNANVWAWNYLSDETVVGASVSPTLYDPTELAAYTPSTPVLLGASFVQTDGTFVPRMQVSWTLPPDQTVVSGGKVYIEYKKSADTDFIQWANHPGSVITDYITDVQSGVSYDVRYRLQNGRGVFSAYSAVASATAGTDTTAPGNITGITATAQAEAIYVTWVNPTDPDFYATELFENTSSSFGGATSLGVIAGTGFLRGGLTAGDHKYYWAVALNNSGVSSGSPDGPADAIALAAPTGSPGPATAPTLAHASTTAQSGGDTAIFVDLLSAGVIAADGGARTITYSVNLTDGSGGIGGPYEFRIVRGSTQVGSIQSTSGTGGVSDNPTETPAAGSIEYKLQIRATSIDANWTVTSATIAVQ